MIKSKAFYKNLEKLNIVQKLPLSDDEKKVFQDTDENQLPDDIFLGDVYNDESKYYRYPAISENEMNLRLAARNAVNLETIKKCAVYFTTLSIISIALYIVALLYRVISNA